MRSAVLLLEGESKYSKRRKNGEDEEQKTTFKDSGISNIEGV
jgi:hypothetical protein